MERFVDRACDVERLSPLTLAFIGDTVFDLFVRENLICDANRPTKQLHNQAVQSVKASAQAELAERIMPILTEKEVGIFKRGRNAHSHHLPKNASERDYHYATGLETLVGWLYLREEYDRLKEIMSYCGKETGEE